MQFQFQAALQLHTHLTDKNYFPSSIQKKKKKFECSTYALSTTFQSCHLLIYYY